MIPYPHIDPEIVRIGPVALRWYGLMYVAGFVSSYLLVKYQVKKMQDESAARGRGAAGKKRSAAAVPDIFLDAVYTYLVVGLVLGARLGYVLFYDPGNYLKHPFEIFAVWRGGMSFHGGMIGSLAAGYLCCRKYGVDFWTAADLVIVTAPLGLGFGRLGNFINAELYGRVTDAPWAMVFPGGGPFPRHPSQLYELALEGVLLFIILWLLKDRKRFTGAMTAAFLMLYGAFRIVAEFFREPDAQLGFIAGPFTMGQALSSLMIFAGAVLYAVLRRKRHSVSKGTGDAEAGGIDDSPR